eukprot:jgi/Tetstr1/455633/TSEL_042444.t1
MAPLAGLSAPRASWEGIEQRTRAERAWLRRLREMSPEAAEAAWRAHVEAAMTKANSNFRAAGSLVGCQSNFHVGEELPQDIASAEGFLPPAVLSAPLRLLRLEAVRRWTGLAAYETVPAEDYKELPYSATTEAMWDTICVVSWRWSQAAPPQLTPDGSPMPPDQFKRFQEALRRVPADRAYLWIDWCCAPQYGPDPGFEALRSKLYFGRAGTLLVVPDYRPASPGALLKGVLQSLTDHLDGVLKRHLGHAAHVMTGSPVRKLQRTRSRSAPGSVRPSDDGSDSGMAGYSPRRPSPTGSQLLPRWGPRGGGGTAATAPASPASSSEAALPEPADVFSEQGSDGSLMSVVVDRYPDDPSQPSTPTSQYTVLSLPGADSPTAPESPALGDLASEARSARQRHGQQQQQQHNQVPPTRTSPSSTLSSLAPSPPTTGPTSSPHEPPTAAAPPAQPLLQPAAGTEAAYGLPSIRGRRGTAPHSPPTAASPQPPAGSPPAAPSSPAQYQPPQPLDGASEAQAPPQAPLGAAPGAATPPSPSSAQPPTAERPPHQEPGQLGHQGAPQDSSSGVAQNMLVLDEAPGEAAEPPQLYSQLSLASTVGDLPDKNEALFRLFPSESNDWNAEGEAAMEGAAAGAPDRREVFTPEQARPRTGAMRTPEGGGGSRGSTPLRDRPRSARPTNETGETGIGGWDPATLRPVVVQSPGEDVAPPSTAAPSWVGRVSVAE